MLKFISKYQASAMVLVTGLFFVLGSTENAQAFNKGYSNKAPHSSYKPNTFGKKNYGKKFDHNKFKSNKRTPIKRTPYRVSTNRKRYGQQPSFNPSRPNPNARMPKFRGKH